jgi:succinylglutamate desuccinylase
METYTRRVTVNPEANCVNAELKAWASSAPAKVLALRTGISKSRIYDWRTERFGANAATMEVVRADRLANARAQIEQAKAVIRLSLGPMADLYPDAVEQVLKGAK